MDVQVFCKHLDEAVSLEQEAAEDGEVVQKGKVSLDSLQKVFKSYHSWIELKNIESNLVGFLIERCAGELSQGQAEGVAVEEDQLDAKTILLDSKKLRILGILWCQGDPGSKLQELKKMASAQGGDSSDDSAIWTDQEGENII